MKKLLVGFVALMFAVPVVASAQTTRPSDRPARDTSADTKAPAWKATPGVHDTKDIIGTRIKNTEGKDIGEIDQLLVDTQSGKVTHAVIGVGGLMGVGEKKVVVPWSELKFSPTAEGKKNAIVMDQAKLESAPRYERSASTDTTSPSASPTTSPSSKSSVRDSDRDGTSNAKDRAPYNPNKQ
jgi:sporulation protein YlmC with PRC-barrel domain